VRRFGLTREEILEWRGGRFGMYGFGLAAAGGDFEFSDLSWLRK
jgi:hypothetical protein